MADLLAIDIGNTNIHLGLWHNNSWDHNWRAQTVNQRMPDEYAVLLESFLKSGGFDWDSVGGVAIASVVPSMTTAFTELVRRYVGTGPLIINARINTVMKAGVEIPDLVGAECVAVIAAVRYVLRGAVIVVGFCTATNIVVIWLDGNYND